MYGTAKEQINSVHKKKNIIKVIISASKSKFLILVHYLSRHMYQGAVVCHSSDPQKIDEKMKEGSQRRRQDSSFRCAPLVRRLAPCIDCLRPEIAPLHMVEAKKEQPHPLWIAVNTR